MKSGKVVLLSSILLAMVLTSGCPSVPQQSQEVGFSFTSLTIGEDNKTTEGAFEDSVSFPKNAVYFHIRMNITNKGLITHELKVLEQESGVYKTRLPLYSEETVNGIKRDWADIGWTDAMGLPPAKAGTEVLVQFAPGEEKKVEAPIFFFNQVVGPELGPVNELRIRIVNARGEVLGEKSVTIRVTG